MAGTAPSLDQWLEEAKQDPKASQVGMYLAHNGVVRANSRKGETVTSMELSWDSAKLQEVIDEALTLPGIFYFRVWLNEGHLEIGDDIMKVLVGGDIRPNVVEALTYLVGRIKTEVVVEAENH